MPTHNPTQSHLPRPPRVHWLALAAALTSACPVAAQSNGDAHGVPNTGDRDQHQQSAATAPTERPTLVFTDDPALPEGMTLDQVLDAAAAPPPADFPDVIMDSPLLSFTLIDQLEYRFADDGRDHFGWDAQGWIGYDYNRLVWKSEGEAAFEGLDEGESENDLLYSRLVDPFWSVQAGVQYANAWEGEDYDDRWSAAFALQGLAPGMFEIDASLYVSDDADVTATLEAEYDLRLTQRLVLQPRAELGFAAQDVPDRNLGAGMTDATLDLRLRYEFKRELAPYIGLRYAFLVGETADLAEAAGGKREDIALLLGVRLAF